MLVFVQTLIRKEQEPIVSWICKKGVMIPINLSATESPLKGKGIRASAASQVTTDMITRSTACRYTHIVLDFTTKLQCVSYSLCSFFLDHFPWIWTNV